MRKLHSGTSTSPQIGGRIFLLQSIYSIIHPKMPVAPITHTHIWPIFRKPSACIGEDWLCSCFLVLRSSLQPNIVSLMGCDENTNGLEPGRCVPWQTDCCLTNEWENVCCWELDRWAVVRQDLRSQRLGSAWDERVVPAGPFPPPAST